jgi:hypothetical protein
MSTMTAAPVTPPIPGQLSAPEFTALLLPPLSMPKRGPKCKLGYHRVFNLLCWVLYPGMPWKGLPLPTDTHGKAIIHSTTVYTVFATGAEAGALWQAVVARVRPLAAAPHLDTSVLHGDGSHTVATKGAMASGPRATTTRRARRSLPSLTIRAPCEPLPL